MPPTTDPPPGDPAEPVPAPPLLRVVTGDPTPEQLAALVAVVSALAGPPTGTPGAGAGPQRTPRSEWSARHRLARPPHRHGPGVWRSSAR